MTRIGTDVLQLPQRLFESIWLCMLLSSSCFVTSTYSSKLDRTYIRHPVAKNTASRTESHLRIQQQQTSQSRSQPSDYKHVVKRNAKAAAEEGNIPNPNRNVLPKHITSRRGRHLANEPPSTRIRRVFDPFTVYLSPYCGASTPPQLSQPQSNHLFTALQDALFDGIFANVASRQEKYQGEQQEQLLVSQTQQSLEEEEVLGDRSGEGLLVFDYVVITDITTKIDAEACLIHVKVGNGVVVFDTLGASTPSSLVPTVEEINTWTLQAISDHFVVPPGLLPDGSPPITGITVKRGNEGGSGEGDSESEVDSETEGDSEGGSDGDDKEGGNGDNVDRDSSTNNVENEQPIGPAEGSEEDKGRVAVMATVGIAVVSLFSLSALLIMKVRNRLFPLKSSSSNTFFVEDASFSVDEMGSTGTRGRRSNPSPSRRGILMMIANRSADLSSRESSNDSHLNDLVPNDDDDCLEIYGSGSDNISPVLAATLANQHHYGSKYGGGAPGDLNNHLTYNNNRRPSHRNANNSDNRSYADGSESSFTVATEAGDSMALKSIPNRNRQAGGAMSPFGPMSGNQSISSGSTGGSPWSPPRGHGGSQDSYESGDHHPSQYPPAPPQPFSSPESFEYDRPVNLRKDMLTSAWSGRMPSSQEDSIRNDSVLQPSYFSAQQERRRRRLEDYGTEDYSSSSATNSSQSSNIAGQNVGRPQSQTSQGYQYGSPQRSSTKNEHQSPASRSSTTSSVTFSSPSPKSPASSRSTFSSPSTSSTVAATATPDRDLGVEIMTSGSSSSSGDGMKLQPSRSRKTQDFVMKIVGMEGSNVETTGSHQQPPLHGKSSRYNSKIKSAGKPETDSSGFVFSSANAGEDFVMMPPRPKSRQDLV